jgi:hypothetical protein
MEEQRNRLNTFIAGCLKRGIQKKEFWNVPIEPTVRLLISSLIGLMRQEILFLSDRETDHERIISELKEVAVMYCRRSLVKE